MENNNLGMNNIVMDVYFLIYLIFFFVSLI